MKIKPEIIAGTAAVALLALNFLPAAKSAEIMVSQTTEISACGRLFEIDANAAGLTAPQRAKIVQKNLDNALIAAKNLSPSAVCVSMENNNPIVTLDGHYVVTADGNSATRNQMTKLQLANKWAQSIRFCLADSAALKDYLSLLSGNYNNNVAVQRATRNDIAVITQDTLLPIDLVTPVSSELSRCGDLVQAVVSHDVPLRTSFDSYIPAGTLVMGKVMDAGAYNQSDYAKKRGMTISFFMLRTPDGKTIPIDGHVLGGINHYKVINAMPQTAQCCGNSLVSENDKVVSIHVNPSKGYIVGSWKGESLDPTILDQQSRFLFDRKGGMNLVEGQHLMLQPSATTAIAIAGLSL
ncbi:MAG: hypothetical protein K2X81_17550 [Candidatus Obscuribacterales bacterium]|nr:hypothetical protein [Candidatus Obscuribacterales bacterium]